jgi:protein SCO1/2
MLRASALVIGAALGVSALAHDAAERRTLDAKEALAVSQAAIGKSVSDHSFTDRSGKSVKLSRYLGKAVVVSLIYTGCTDICPTSTQTLAQAVREAEKTLGTGKFTVLTIGFDTERDTPQAMRDYARKQRISSPDWDFLSANHATLDALARETGFSYVASTKGFDHLAQATLLDGNGRVYRQVYGEVFEPPFFVGPLVQLVTGAPKPAETLGDWIEKVRLLCTIYDPAAGRYRIDTTIIVEFAVGLLLTIATIAWLVRERRRSRKTTA